MNIGETIEVGQFTVRCGMRPDNPAWPVYLVYRGEKLIGRQFSMPSRSDCECLQHGSAVYAYATIAYKKPKNRGVAADKTLGWRKRAAA
jgi:hypothetical protein